MHTCTYRKKVIKVLCVKVIPNFTKINVHVNNYIVFKRWLKILSLHKLKIKNKS